MRTTSRKTHKGISICAGLVVGRTVRYSHRNLNASPPQEAHAPDLEWSNFLGAQTRSCENIENLASQQRSSGHKTELNALLEGYTLLMTDVVLIERVKHLIFEDHMDARSAIQHAFVEARTIINSSAEAHLKEKTFDVDTCMEFLISSLDQGTSTQRNPPLKDRIILMGHPTPQDVIHFHQSGVAGIVCEFGSHLSHAAILARSFNIPTLFSVDGIFKTHVVGQMAILDTSEHCLTINPTRSELRKAEARRAVDLLINQKLRSNAASIARTTDGARVAVYANADGPIDSRSILKQGAEGIGLMRTEFLHLASDYSPSAAESAALFKITSATVAPRWLTVRLLDAGGDKPYPSGHSFPSGPFGVRGIRFLIRENRILENQLTALIHANTHGNIRILLPYVTDVEEVRTVKRKMFEIWSRISQDERMGLHFPIVGAMIETPAACQLLDHLSTECDFLSVGSNDLTQHVLCIDRDSQTQTKNESSFHPAVLRTLAGVFVFQKKIDRSISLCGELASDPTAIELLIGLGCRHLSVQHSQIPLIKEIIRHLDVAEAELLAQKVLSMVSAHDIHKLLLERYENTFDYWVGPKNKHHRAG